MQRQKPHLTSSNLHRLNVHEVCTDKGYVKDVTASTKKRANVGPTGIRRCHVVSLSARCWPDFPCWLGWYIAMWMSLSVTNVPYGMCGQRIIRALYAIWSVIKVHVMNGWGTNESFRVTSLVYEETTCMHRLIWVFAERIGQKAYFEYITSKFLKG